MTAGAAQIAFAIEDSYGNLGGTPTWYQPGTDIEVDGPTLDNQLQRQRQPDSPKSGRSREGNIRGDVSVTFTLTDGNWLPLIFDASSNTELTEDTSEEKPSATWYFDADVVGQQTARFCQGAFVESASIQYQQGEEVRVTLSMAYKDEATDLDAPSSISQPNESDAFLWHGMTPKRSGTEIPEVQSLEIQLDNLAQGRRDQSRHFTRATAGAYELGFNIEAIYQQQDLLEDAYGSSAATSTQDTVGTVDHSAEFVNANSVTHTFTLSNAQAANYTWNQLVGEEDLTEPAEFHCSDISVAVA